MAATANSPIKYGKTPRFLSPLVALNSTITKRGQKRNRTVRAVIPRVVWRSGSRGSITPVDVSQTIKRSIIRESVWRFSRRQNPGILPVDGRMGDGDSRGGPA